MSCFASGTMILTDQGEVAVEKLKPGAMVLTKENGYQPIRWIAVKPLSGRFLLDNPHLGPVLVRRDAFGADLPVADTMMAPNTRIPVSAGRSGLFGNQDEMIAVKNFIDHAGVQRIDTTGILYVHMMFDGHQVISVNGVWVECFNTADQTLGFKGNSQRNEIHEIFPVLKSNRRMNRPVGPKLRVNAQSLRNFL